jgi:hypothetical protein
MRQTNLSFEELVAQIKNPIDTPVCLLINEVGVILFEDKSMREKSEAFLRELMGDKEMDENERMIAYSFLSCLEDPATETAATLKKFQEENPEDTEVANEQVKMVKHTLTTH